jgi:hypothetical protein
MNLSDLTVSVIFAVPTIRQRLTKDSGAAKEPNWLPAPDGPFLCDPPHLHTRTRSSEWHVEEAAAAACTITSKRQGRVHVNSLAALRRHLLLQFLFKLLHVEASASLHRGEIEEGL